MNKSQIASILIGLSVFCGILIIPFPVGLYYVTRIVICGGAIYAAIQINKYFPEEFNRVVLLWFLAFLFNPLLPLYFQARLMWIILDIVALIAFYSSAQLFKNSISVIKETKEFGGSNSKQHGQDTYTSADGTEYVGEWKDGKQHGQGTFTSASGIKYVGKWKDGKQHGQGTETYADGEGYVGEWKDGKPHGQGTNTNKNFFGGIKYVGEWKDGKPHGQGTETYANAEKYVESGAQDQYVGEFKDGEKHGQGTYTYAHGNQYVGEYNYGSKHGLGTYIKVDGTKTIAAWKHDDRTRPFDKDELNLYTIEGKSEIESDDNPHLHKELETFVRYFFEVVKEVYQKGQNNFEVKDVYNFREKFKLESKNRAIENLGVWKLSKAEADAILFTSYHDQTIVNQILGKNGRIDFNHVKVQAVMKYLETIK